MIQNGKWSKSWEHSGRDPKTKHEEFIFDELELGEPVKGGLEV